MAAETHSFIDIAALDGVRRHFAAGDAVMVLTTNLAQVIWCNGPGATFLGFSGIEAAIGSESGLSATARRQIGALPGFPDVGTDRPVAVRLAAGVTTQTAALRASNLTLPGGDSAIMLVSPAASLSSRDERETAARAIGGFEEAGSYVALLGPAGEILAATPGFEKLGLGQQALETLADDVAAERDRLLKRIVRTDGSALPVGFASLTDEPARYLLITVDEGGIEEYEPVPSALPIGVVDDSQLAAAARPALADERGSAPAMITAEAPEQRPFGAGAETTGGESRQTPTQGAAQHDSWYFSDRSSTGLPAAEPGAPAAVDRMSTPVRFVWRTDAEGRFSSISPEFAAAVGAAASDLVGESFADVAKRLALDPDEEIVGLLARRDTWSGRSVLWPIAGTKLKVPVDLAALPAYGRDRQFEGFRGFGVVRTGEAVADPDAIGMGLVEGVAQPSEREIPAAEPDVAAARADEATKPTEPGAPAGIADPFKGEVPALEIAPKPQRRLSDKIIRLAEHRQPANDKGLTPLERNAFREIGEQLKRASGVAPGAPAEDKEASRAEAEVAETQVPRNERPRTEQAPADTTSGADGDIAPEAAGDTSAVPAATGTAPVRTVSATDAPEWRAPAAGPTQEPTVDAIEVASPAEPEASDAQAAETDATRPTPSAAEATPDVSTVDNESAASGESPASRADGAETQQVGTPQDLPEPTARAENDEVSKAAGAVAPDATATARSVDREPVVSGESSRVEGETVGAKAGPKTPGVVEVRPQDRVSRSLLDFAAAADNENKPGIEAASATDVSEAPSAKAPSPGADKTLKAVPTAEPHTSPPPLKQSGFLPSAFAEPNEKRADTSILAQLPIPVLIHAGDMLHYANDAFFELTGYESIGQFADAGGLDALLSGPAADRKEGDNRVMLRTRRGEEFPVSAFLQSVPWLGGKALLLTLTRHTASSPAASVPSTEDQDLRARVAELRTILDTATDGVVLIDNDGNVSSISRPAEALFGYDSDQLVGKPFTSLFAIESQRAARDYLSGLSEHGVASVLNDGREVIGREAQGRFIPLFMTIGRLPGNGGYCAVLRDITQWKRAEEDLTQARAQAERTSTQKSDFLARVSHEIRTPLNAIIGFSELMLDEKFGPVANDRYRDYLRDINRSGNHVLDLVNDLLDISKIEAGQQEMDYEAVALNDALGETVAMMQPQANRERVIIRSSFASKLPEVVADLRSVRQIALNVLSNAIRYTQAGGQVIVSTAHEPNGEVVMRVRDTGIGMTQAEIEQALKPFKQVNALKRARGDGTGLGLPLTKAMVEANRAKFAIYSTPGEGTLVEITFPSTRVLAE